MFFAKHKTHMPTEEEALPGRSQPMPVAPRHLVNGTPLEPPFPDGLETAVFGMGCFWGAERKFWQAEGVYTTAVGYAGGFTPNPTYEEVCSGRTGHTEVVLVVFDPMKVSYEELLRIFWTNHDPTQGMRQGNDAGTQYRSAIYTGYPFGHGAGYPFGHGAGAGAGAGSDLQQKAAEASRDAYQEALTEAGYGTITTEIREAPAFYYAEAYHQQYLARNPSGYCGLGGTGVSCPVGLPPASE